MAADGSLKVGVLAIQGGFAEHMQALERQTGVEGVEVRTPFELLSCDALILPGGESTAIGHGLEDANMLDDIKEFCATKPVSARAPPRAARRPAKLLPPPPCLPASYARTLHALRYNDEPAEHTGTATLCRFSTPGFRLAGMEHLEEPPTPQVLSSVLRSPASQFHLLLLPYEVAPEPEP